MASVFRKDDNHSEKAKRNAFPKTFETNITTKFGQLLPVFCKPVMNGETIRIEPTMNFNFLPMVFPIQNRVRASLEFYYVRNRNLWKDWMDFQFKMRDGLEPPYHVFCEDTYREMLKVGGLLDNLGVPVVLHGDYNVKLDTNNPSNIHTSFYDPFTGTFDDEYKMTIVRNSPDNLYHNVIQRIKPTGHISDNLYTLKMLPKPIPVGNGGYFQYNIDYLPSTPNNIFYLFGYETYDAETTVVEEFDVRQNREVEDSQDFSNNRTSIASSRRDKNSVSNKRSESTSSSSVTTSTTYTTKSIRPVVIEVDIDGLGVGTQDFLVANLVSIVGIFQKGNIYDAIISFNANVKEVFGDMGVPLSDLTLDSLPFPYIDRSGNLANTYGLHINSLPARGIKSIYNARIRNEANNPFMVNGRPEYNKYIDNEEGGADSDFYPIYYRNWHDDAFTTALHSPQHGDAPLVGLTNNGETPYIVTFSNDDGTKTKVQFSNTANGVQVVDNPSQADGYSGQLQEAMMEAVRFGISINDFRNVNSFQRWLENNVRRGYKYRDQIKAHYNVEVNYDTLDMPEYIGGMSRDMNVQQVTQTTENSYGNLGDFSGQAWIRGDMEHSINHFCDEEGYVIGLLSIMPVAPYTQVIPKHLLRENAFDYYSPEFGHIGFQPILNREIAPLQSFYEQNGDEVFGYQRAWYDSLDSISEVHGKFRTQFRNFVINRTFNSVPQLGADFTTMSDDDVNSVFYVDDNEDKILGQILFKYESLLPIPVYGIPRIE